ncbi:MULTISPECIES: MFS transporter [unclassified Novosphingobium]|uniref:MFS transporter n=1 Tax=unclassified Novosphingobium TaxID=2644732 RepID=UPI000D317F67|nr:MULTISPECIES: MFS transporter [unclassified Novosphingobium]PTR12101.1 cyanate permease [Novosphingobium sp. GV055]PUB05502.1 cyanate permease [Novosphingobium sp. GV061]PUB21735.1 cyanate permease [Novosphingobium sp. GV079]PUB43508.1 cyanate permease [Novosphingobium sp. GV027]
MSAGHHAFTAREGVVALAVSLALFLGQGIVFAGMGLALFATGQALHLGPAALGAAFTTVIVGASAGATLPVWLITRIGGRLTMTGGALVMAAGLALAGLASGLALLLPAMALVGAGFSLLANTPAYAMIAGWSGPRTNRVLGLYLMIGALGNAAGPALGQELITDGLGYWRGTCGLALGLALLLLAVLRDPPAPALPNAPRAAGWWRPLLGPRFAMLASAMVLSQAVIMTALSVAPAHLSPALGWTAGGVARVLALQGLLGALGTGLAGFALRHVRAVRLLALSLLATALGMGALAQGGALMVNWGFVPLFGVGSALVAMAVTVLLMEWFGHETGTAGLALCWTLAGLAALGPGLAGVLAQWTGSYAGAIWLLGASCVPVAVAAGVLHRAKPIETPSSRA